MGGRRTTNRPAGRVMCRAAPTLTLPHEGGGDQSRPVVMGYGSSNGIGASPALRETAGHRSWPWVGMLRGLDDGR